MSALLTEYFAHRAMAIPTPSFDALSMGSPAPKPLYGHRRGECLWPLGAAERAGDWRTLFCCAPVEAGRSYCTDHARRAYQTPPEAALGCPAGRR